MNYVGVIFGGALILSAILWYSYGRRVYKGSVWETEEDIQLNDRNRAVQLE